MAVLARWSAVSYERGTPVGAQVKEAPPSRITGPIEPLPLSGCWGAQMESSNLGALQLRTGLHSYCGRGPFWDRLLTQGRQAHRQLVLGSEPRAKSQ